MLHFLANKAAQDQYAMWAAYYAQYYQQQPQAVNGVASGQEHPQQAGGQYDESVYKQWIEYYKACGMTAEAEAMEKNLRDYKNAQKVCPVYPHEVLIVLTIACFLLAKR